jgi:hypothetical protein
LLDFHPPGVRRIARKRFKFEILKISTLGDQHIGQGFQSYFWYREMLSFAEILFAFLGIVTVSDSNFGWSLSDVLFWILVRNLLVELVSNLVKLN